MILNKLVHQIYDCFGKKWAIRYLDNYLSYLVWYSERIEKKSTIPILKDINHEIFHNFIKFLKKIIKAEIYWKFRDRKQAEIHTKEAHRIYKKYKNLFVNLFKQYKKLGIFERSLNILLESMI